MNVNLQGICPLTGKIYLDNFVTKIIKLTLGWLMLFYYEDTDKNYKILIAKISS